MALLLLLIIFVLLFRIIYQAKFGIRQSVLISVVFFGIILTIITELLSLIRLLEFKSILLFWLSVILILIYISNRQHSRIKFLRVILFNKIKSLYFSVIKSPFEIIIFAFILFVLLVTLFLALSYPPNTGDVISYHLPKITHWIQNHTVEFYPTHILRQLYTSPWSEYLLLHFYILSASDRFFNLPQWLGMVISLIGISLITKFFISDRNAQLISGFILITLPMGILQSTGTNNDYILSAWLVCSLFFSWQSLRDYSFFYLLLAGCSLGLAILTKPTAYLFLTPYIVLFGICSFKKIKFKAFLFVIFLIIVVICINSFFYIRNFKTFSNPFGPNREFSNDNLRYTNETHDIRFLISNLLRNTSLHLGTQSNFLNDFFYHSVLETHRFMGINTNDKRITWSNTTFGYQNIVSSIGASDGTAGNFIHIFLFVISIILILPTVKHIKRTRRFLFFGYIFATATGFLLFSFYLKWQPWHSRLHLPFFIMSSVPIGITLYLMPKKIYLVLLSILMITSLPYIINNQDRSLLYFGFSKFDRSDQYFNQMRNLKQIYNDTVKEISLTRCKHIGLFVWGDDPEYLYWLLLNHKKQNYRIEHILVQNVSSIFSSKDSYKDFDPCIIVSSRTKDDEIKYKGILYKKFWSPKTTEYYYPSLYLKKVL